MSLPLIITPAAEIDIAEALNWYERKRSGLGDEFVLCLEAGLDQIRRAPPAATEVLPGVRRVVVRRFPYGIFYRIDETKSPYSPSTTTNAIQEDGRNGHSHFTHSYCGARL